MGWGYLGSIDSLEGFLKMHEAAGNLWLPARQEYVTQGKNPAVVVAGSSAKDSAHQQTDELSDTRLPSIWFKQNLQFAFHECLVDNDFGRHIGEFALLPSFHLLSHRLEVALHSIHTDRDAIDEREGL
jgi:hypothetical protein